MDYDQITFSAFIYLIIWFDHFFIYVGTIGNLCQENTEIYFFYIYNSLLKQIDINTAN